MLTEEEKKFILNIVDNLNCAREDVLIDNDDISLDIRITDSDIKMSRWAYLAVHFLRSDLKLDFANLKVGRFTLKELNLDD